MPSSKYEVEIKIALDEVSRIQERILELCGVKTNAEVQIDTYYNHPSRDFNRTDEALRLRRREQIEKYAGNGSIPQIKTELTFKGPKIDDTTKTRFEMSTGVEDDEAMSVILERLGFAKVAQIVKRRTFYKVNNITVSIDDVEGIGTFMELETISDSEDLIPYYKDTMFALLKDLGLEKAKSIRESYLELYLLRSTSS